MISILICVGVLRRNWYLEITNENSLTNKNKCYIRIWIKSVVEDVSNFIKFIWMFINKINVMIYESPYLFLLQYTPPQWKCLKNNK